MSMVGFPLLLIPLAIYNIIAFLMQGVSFTNPLLQVPLVSGKLWAVSLGDMLVALGVLMLWLEIVKAARPGGKYLTDHLLSFLVLGAAGAEFVMRPEFANSTFFMLSLLAMVEFFTGIALRAKRGGRARAVVATPVAAPEPVTHVEPAPAPAVTEPAVVPPAASAAESAPSEHAGPHPAPAAGEPSRQVEAPGLQPTTITPEPPSQTEPPKP